MDGVQWNADSFVSPSEVDGGGPSRIMQQHDYGQEDANRQLREVECEDEVGFPEREPIVVSLLDIARPAKRRGESAFLNLRSVYRGADMMSDRCCEEV